MPVISVTSDPEALTLQVVAEFAVPVQRLWDAYTDPRQIEKFWGPPTYPATFRRHDVYPGGRSEYCMVGPEGDESRGYWEWIEVDGPNSFTVLDGFALPDGSPNRDLPMCRMVFAFESVEGGSRLVTTTSYNSIDELEQLLAMGMDEGLRAAMGQIDDVVADLTRYAAGADTDLTIFNDLQVRVSRVIRGSVDQVWAAHHDPALLRRWMLGPDGWEMPVCEVGAEVGDTYRYEWAMPDGSNRFGFTGEVLEVAAPHRVTTTEAMIGSDGPSTRNEMTFTACEDGTVLSTVITYPSVELRDAILATGMVDGMEASYARLESSVLG